MPASAARAFPVTLERVHAWSARTRSLFLRLPAGAAMPFDPGQFVSLTLPAGGGAPLVRAYSLASAPEDELLEICVDRVPGGVGSEWLFGRTGGETLAMQGPFGSFRLAEPPDAPMVFVGDGTGIAPIRPMVRRAVARGGTQPIAVLQGRRPGEVALFADELAALATRHPHLACEVLDAEAGEGPGAHRALEVAVRNRYVETDDDRRRHFWICGVGDLVTRLRDLLRGAGYERRAVRAEKW